MRYFVSWSGLNTSIISDIYLRQSKVAGTLLTATDHVPVISVADLGGYPGVQRNLPF